jgi:hypothetical protein
MITAGAAVLASAAAALANPVFINIGYQAQATAVSTDGTVVVGVQSGSIFRWTQATGMTLLGAGTEPRVSADGSAMAWQGSGNVYRWTALQGAVVIGAAAASSATISGDGSTVAWGNQRWSTAGWSTTLQPPAGTAQPRVTALSFDGSIAVGSTNTFIPSRWDGAGVGVSLGSIPGYPVEGSAGAVSPDGQTVLGSSSGSPLYDLFRWRQDVGMVGVHAGLAGPTVYGATTDGAIAIGMANSAQAFVWREGFGSALLNGLLHNRYGINIPSIDLEYAKGISGDGRTVVGYGWDYSVNKPMAWVVQLDSSIPAPGTAAAFAVLSAFGMRRRR